MQLRMRAATVGLTVILLLQPVAILACVCACLALESGSGDLQVSASEAAHAGCHHDASPSAGSDQYEGPAFAQSPGFCTHSAPDPATLRSGTADAAFRVVPAIVSRALPTSSALTGDSVVRAPVGSESPPGARFSSPLRI